MVDVTPTIIYDYIVSRGSDRRTVVQHGVVGHGDGIMVMALLEPRRGR
jgi:hypothetical protein